MRSHDTSMATVSWSGLDRAMKLLLDEDVPVQLVEPLRRHRIRSSLRAQARVLYAAGPSREEVNDDEMLRLALTKEAC